MPLQNDANTKLSQEIYRNIIKSGLHRAAIKTLVLPYLDVIKSITRKIDHQHQSILNFEGKVVANYKPSMINQMYHLKEAIVKVSPEWLKQKSESTNMLTILKGWWSEGHFRSKPAIAKWKTSKFRKTMQIIVMLLSRVFERKGGSNFLDKWISIIYQTMTSRVTLNWGELISSNLDNQLKEITQRTPILHVHVSYGCNVCQHRISITRMEVGTKVSISSCLLQDALGKQV